MFDSPDDFSRQLKALRDKANVANLKTTLKSDGALNVEGTQLDEIAEHVERGGGSITASATDGESYHSHDHSAHDDIDTEGAEPESQTWWGYVKDALDRIF